MAAIPRSIQVGAAIIRHDGKILIARRKDDDHLGGLWEFPGGKREKGESFEACLKREIAEELRGRIEVERLWKVVSHPYPDRVVELHFYFCRFTGGNLRAIGCQDFRWVLPEELAQFSFPPADAELIKELSTQAESSCFRYARGNSKFPSSQDTAAP